MKQKVLRLLLPLAVASLVLAGCQETAQQSEQPQPSSEQQSSESQPASSSVVNSYTIKFVNDDGTLLQEGLVDEGEMPVYEGQTPTKAATAQYTYTFDKWVPEIVAAVADATYTASYTSEAVVHPDPTITINGEKTLSVDAGSSVALPSVTAADHTGKALEVEFEDEFGGSTISNGQFTSKIAGAHNIIFYTEDEFGGSATDSVTVNVIPANAETFDVSAAENDPTNITTYGTYKENFAKGTNSPYYKSLVDGREASEISATSDAISGNSLVFNARLLLGNAAYCLFGKVINDVVLRDTQVTYTISFDYKAINADGSFNGIYFSPSYDTPNGSVGKDTKLSPVVGEVVHFEETYSRFVFPSTSANCYLRIFNYNASNPDVDSFIAIDNIVVTAKEETQITFVTPTTEQLLAEGGFTWNMSSSAAEVSNTTFTAVADVENETAKAAMQASNLFGENVIHLVGQADHNMKSLNSTNVISGKILEVSFIYYAVTDLAHIIFMGCNGGNPTIEGDNLTRETIDGNIKKITAKLLLSSYSGADVVNFYGGSASDEIYIASITAKLYDYIPPQEVIDKPDAHVPTTAELAAGYTWDMVNNFLDFDNSEYIDVANMEDATIKAAIQGNSDFGTNVLRFQGGLMGLGIGAANLVPGYILTVDIDYYCVADGFQYFILRGASDADNVTQLDTSWSRTTVSGNFKHFHFQGALPRSLRDTTMTTYNGSVNMLIGKVTISCVEPEETFENYTPTAAELAEGFTYEIGGSKHLGFSACNEVTKVEKIADSGIKAELQGKGTYVDHVTLGGGSNAIIVGIDTTTVPNGKEFTIVLEYYEVSAVSNFLVNGSGVPVQKEDISGHLKRVTYNTKPTNNFGYFSLYNAGEVYIYKCTITVVDYVAPADQTPNGHKVNDVITVYQSGAGFAGGTKNGFAVANYDGAIDSELSAHAGLGSAPKKITYDNPHDYVEINNGNQTKIEAGVTYLITMEVYNVDCNGAIILMFDSNGNSGDCFNTLTTAGLSAGYHQLTVEVQAQHNVDWLCLHCGTANASGSFYLGNVTVTVLALA